MGGLFHRMLKAATTFRDGETPRAFWLRPSDMEIWERSLRIEGLHDPYVILHEEFGEFCGLPVHALSATDYLSYCEYHTPRGIYVEPLPEVEPAWMS